MLRKAKKVPSGLRYPGRPQTALRTPNPDFTIDPHQDIMERSGRDSDESAFPPLHLREYCFIRWLAEGNAYKWHEFAPP